jgi:hypothetical protein
MSRSGKYEGEKMCISDCQGLGNKGRMDSDWFFLSDEYILKLDFRIAQFCEHNKK